MAQIDAPHRELFRCEDPGAARRNWPYEVLIDIRGYGLEELTFAQVKKKNSKNTMLNVQDLTTDFSALTLYAIELLLSSRAASDTKLESHPLLGDGI
jgi:hypothetical protein